MRTVRITLSAVVLAVACVPAAASAGNQCDVKFYDDQIGPATVRTPHLVC